MEARLLWRRGPPMKNLVCFLEEPSAKEMLRGVLPRLLPDDIVCTYIVFDGKQDLEKQFVRKLRGWLKPDSFFIILRDQDSSDCVITKQKLVALCDEAGKADSSLIRIACHELESFYFGDLSAVEMGLELTGILKKSKKSMYRNPDAIINPCDELEKLTDGKYQHIGGSRSISPYLSLNNNNSHSFNILLSGIIKLCGINGHINKGGDNI